MTGPYIVSPTRPGDTPRNSIQLNVIVVVDVARALANGNLDGALMLVDNSVDQAGRPSAGRGTPALVTQCNAGMVINWIVYPVGPFGVPAPVAIESICFDEQVCFKLASYGAVDIARSPDYVPGSRPAMIIGPGWCCRGWRRSATAIGSSSRWAMHGWAHRPRRSTSGMCRWHHRWRRTQWRCAARRNHASSVKGGKNGQGSAARRCPERIFPRWRAGAARHGRGVEEYRGAAQPFPRYRSARPPSAAHVDECRAGPVRALQPGLGTARGHRAAPGRGDHPQILSQWLPPDMAARRAAAALCERARRRRRDDAGLHRSPCAVPPIMAFAAASPPMPALRAHSNSMAGPSRRRTCRVPSSPRCANMSPWPPPQSSSPMATIGAMPDRALLL
jgi:hypothetical protein